MRLKQLEDVPVGELIVWLLRPAASAALRSAGLRQTVLTAVRSVLLALQR